MDTSTCTTCGQRDDHAEQRKKSSFVLPNQHCYHLVNSAAPDGGPVTMTWRCCWCGEAAPSAGVINAQPVVHGWHV